MPSSSKKKKSAKKSIKGWFMSGAQPKEFSAELDGSTSHSGTRSAHMFSNENFSKDSSWGTLMQQMGADQYLDKRVRMKLWVKSKNVKGWLSPWMRVDGNERGDTLSFDNFCTRQIKGTTDWTEHQIVLDVPPSSTNIAFGVMLGGKGDAWFDDVSFEVVDKSVPITDCPCSRNNRPAQGVNLNFEEDEDDDE
jgi:hypothetical protein